jgi:hypothetical protein
LFGASARHGKALEVNRQSKIFQGLTCHLATASDRRACMKTKLTVLAVLIIAILFSFGVWKHERWLTARNQYILIMQQTLDTGLRTQGTGEDRVAAVDEAKVIRGIAARRLIRVIEGKILPLSSSDRHWLEEARKEADKK